jgi:hypothetical protein
MVYSSYLIKNVHDIKFNNEISPMFIRYDNNHIIDNGEDGLCMSVKHELGQL